MRSLNLFLSTLSLALAVALPGSSLAVNTTSCGNAPYNPKWYACYNTTAGSVLCPIVNGVAMKLCGRDCYTPLQYTCNGYSLSPLPIYSGPVVLHTLAPGQEFDRRFVQAGGGGRFTIDGSNSRYCPLHDTSLCPDWFTTAITGSSLAVVVPGGQRIFISKDGALSYTMPHSTAMPNVLYPAGGLALSNAGYFGPNGTSWLACKVPGSDELFHVVADLPQVNTRGADCRGVYLVAQNQPKGDVSAYEYL